MPEPHIITLRRPVGPKGHEITELRLREPTAGEVLKASRETGRGLALSLLAQVAGLDQAVISLVPGRKTDEALAYLMTFIEPIFAEQVETDPPDEMTIELPEEIQIGTTWVPRLVLREPTLGELIKGDKYDGMQRSIVIVGLISDTPRAIVEMIPISAFAKAALFVRGFTDAAPSSGGGQLGA